MTQTFFVKMMFTPLFYFIMVKIIIIKNILNNRFKNQIKFSRTCRGIFLRPGPRHQMRILGS